MKQFVFISVVISIVIITIIYCYNQNVQKITENSNTNMQETQINIEGDSTLKNNEEEMTDTVEHNIVSNNSQHNGMPNLNMKIGDYHDTIILYDNPTTRKLLEKMPLTISMNELNGNEKYYYFKQSFPTHSEQVETIRKGDLMLYGTDCLVLFYENVTNSYAYTKIGYVSNPNALENVIGIENVQITFDILT